MLSIHFMFSVHFIKKIARLCVVGKVPSKVEIEAYDTRKLLNKFKESAWKFVYFTSAETFILSVTYNEPWFRDSKTFWVGPGDLVWPNMQMK